MSTRDAQEQHGQEALPCVPVSTDEIQGAIQWLANPYDEQLSVV